MHDLHGQLTGPVRPGEVDGESLMAEIIVTLTPKLDPTWAAAMRLLLGPEPAPGPAAEPVVCLCDEDLVAPWVAALDWVIPDEVSITPAGVATFIRDLKQVRDTFIAAAQAGDAALDAANRALEAALADLAHARNELHDLRFRPLRRTT